MVMDERTMLAAHSLGPPCERFNCKESAGLANERGLYARFVRLVNIYSCKDERNYRCTRTNSQFKLFSKTTNTDLPHYQGQKNIEILRFWGKLS